MSKRCELQKKFYKEHGNYKGQGKYNDQYVKWLEDKIIETTKEVNEYIEIVKKERGECCQRCDGVNDECYVNKNIPLYIGNLKFDDNNEY